MARAYMLVQRHPRAIDAAIVGLLLLIGLPALMPDARAAGFGVDPVLSVAVCVPVLLRRSRPVAAVLLAGAIGLCQVAFARAPSLTDLALVVVVYSGVAYGPRWLSVVCALGSLAAPALTIVRWARGAFDDPRSVAYLYLVLLTPFVIGWVVGQAGRYRRAYLAGVEERSVRLEYERDARAGIAVAAERARIARDMHDVVAHAVSVMVIQASGAAYALDEHPEQSRRALDTIADTGRQTLAELRRVLGVLRAGDGSSGYLPQPGVAQLTELISQIRATGLAAELELEGVPVELSAGGQLAVFRLVQEALTNAVKHAGPAASVRAVLRYRPDAIEVEVIDDGRGAAADATGGRPDPGRRGADPSGATGGGHGLVGMRERVALFDGAMTAGPRPGGGYGVSIRLPMAAVAPAQAASPTPAAPRTPVSPVTAESTVLEATR